MFNNRIQKEGFLNVKREFELKFRKRELESKIMVGLRRKELEK